MLLETLLLSARKRELNMSPMQLKISWMVATRVKPHAAKDRRGKLALRGTAALPDLFCNAGARLAFDSHTLRNVAA